MSDSSRSTEEAPGNAQRLLEALRTAATDAGARDALAEIGQRARAIVEELARGTRAGAPAPPAPAEDFPQEAESASGCASGSAVPGGGVSQIHYRLEELRACLGEVTDVLEATVERLETVELQLGDPRSGIERQLSEGIQRCERVLMGIEHRALMETGPAGIPPRASDMATGSAPAGPGAPVALVVSASSSQRSHLCLALERQGFHTLAATDLAAALRIAARHAPAVGLLAIEGSSETCADFLDDWKESEDRGSLPRAAVLVRGGEAGDAFALGLTVIREEHGEAAMAASLVELLGRGGEDAAAS